MVDVNQINNLVHNIPILTGELGPNLKTEVITFLKCCEHVDNCVTEIDGKEVLMRLIVTRIRARASEVLIGVEDNGFEEFKKVVREKLLQNKPYHILRSELQSVYQFPGESVENFGSRLQNLLRECKDAIVLEDESGLKALHNELEEQAVYIFKSGLNNTNLRWFCLSDNEKCLSTLVNKAAKLEAADKQINMANRFQIPNQAYGNVPINKFVDPTPYTQNTNTHSYHKNNYSQNINNNRRNNTSYINFNKNENNKFNNNYKQTDKLAIKCNFCGKNGHYFVECRLRKNTPFCTNCKLYGQIAQYCREKSNQNVNSQKQVRIINKNKSNNNKFKEIICDFCKRRNHTISSCSAKQEWDKKNGAQPSGN